MSIYIIFSLLFVLLKIIKKMCVYRCNFYLIRATFIIISFLSYINWISVIFLSFFQHKNNRNYETQRLPILIQALLHNLLYTCMQIISITKIFNFLCPILSQLPHYFPCINKRYSHAPEVSFSVPQQSFFSLQETNGFVLYTPLHFMISWL